MDRKCLEINCEQEVQKTHDCLIDFLRKYHKKGYVVALSGGIDSSVVGTLCVEALGKDRVYGLLLPEKDSSSDTLRLSELIAKHLGIRYENIDLTSMLEAVGCYQNRDDAIRSVFPDYTSKCKSKITLPEIGENKKIRLFSIVIETPDGKRHKKRLPPEAYLGIVAATNYKQRIRKMKEYYYADRMNYATTGTPNRQEYDQGFFVKLGDGSADIKPIAHLYKTQVYQLARYMGVPDEICNRAPTTDTYSMEQSQEEFYFSLPYEKMDICLYGKNNGITPEDVSKAVDLSVKQVEYVYQDIDNKRKVTQYLHLSPVLVGDVPEVKH